jgi:thioredoxin 1
MKNMKRTFLVILTWVFLAFTTWACNNVNTGNTDNTKNSGVTAGNEVTDKGEVKPEYLTVETFKEKVWDYEENPQKWVYEGKEPAIIDFYADWCRPCRMVAPILDELSKDYAGKVKIYKIDTQVERELAAVFQVQSIPAFLYIPLEGQPQMDRGFKDKAAFQRIISEVLLIN